MRLLFCLWPRPVARFWPADMLVRCVIAWAEDLPDAVATRWLAGAGVELLDLLIASEYWLCFYSLRSQGAPQTKNIFTSPKACRDTHVVINRMLAVHRA